MSTPEQIEEWIHEVEERPSSAPIILQYISKRLFDLINRNEELLAENIELRTGRKVEEFEQRITSLEYQLNILKRQLSGNEIQVSTPKSGSIGLIIYNHLGKIICIELKYDLFKSGTVNPTNILNFPEDKIPPRIFLTELTEELLFVFDSGRTETFPVSTIPVQDHDTMNWENAWGVEPRGGEELSTILPIAKMTLFDYCTQVSRRGCAKKIIISSLDNHISRKFIGTGVKQRPDRSCALFLANKSDQMILTSQEGFLLNILVDQLGYTAEEIIRLSATDHILTGFVIGAKKFIVVVTTNGKVIQRETSWLDLADSFRSKGQSIFSQSRREAGIRCVGAAAVTEEDWGAILLSNGEIRLSKIAELFSAGNLDGLQGETRVVDFTAFSMYR